MNIETHTFSTKNDGIEYYGEVLCEIGIALPFLIAENYPTTNPLTWFLKGVIIVPAIILWLFLAGWLFMSVGICLSIIGESWNDMQSRN